MEWVCMHCARVVDVPEVVEICTLSARTGPNQDGEKVSTTGEVCWCDIHCAREYDASDDEVDLDVQSGQLFDEFEGDEVVLDIQGAVQSGLGKVKSTMDYAQGVVDKASIIAGELDKPNVGQNTMQVVVKKYPKLPNVDTVEQATVLDAFTVRHDLPSAVERGVTVDEMSFAHLMSTPSWLTTIRISSTQETGDLVWSSPMTIAPKVMITPDLSTVTPTLAGYMAVPFGFWQCDLELTIEFVATKVHTTRLYFGLVYGGSASAIPFQQITGQYGMALDLNAANTTIKVRIPYRTNVQQLRVPRPSDADPRTCSLGDMGLWVINPLVANESVADSADINVYFNLVPTAGRDDYGLQFMGPNMQDFTA